MENNVDKNFSRQTILNLLSGYEKCGQLKEDFYALTPDKRLAMAEKLIDYALPKIKSIEAASMESSPKSSLSERLQNVLKTIQQEQ